MAQFASMLCMLITAWLLQGALGSFSFPSFHNSSLAIVLSMRELMICDPDMSYDRLLLRHHFRKLQLGMAFCEILGCGGTDKSGLC